MTTNGILLYLLAGDVLRWRYRRILPTGHEVGEGGETMRKKRVTGFLLFALLAAYLMPGQASAYTGGLLEGKPVTLISSAGAQGTVSTATDGDEATYTVLYRPTSPGYPSTASAELAKPTMITNYQVNMGGVPATIDWIYWDNTSSSTNIVTNGTKTAVTLPKAVRYVQVYATSNPSTVNLYEMDVFGTVVAPPTAVTGVQATATSGQVALTWEAHSSTDVTGYNVYVNGVKRNTTPITVTNYTVTGLTNGTSYSFRVAAVDRYDQEGAMSALVTATPPIPPDSTPPPDPTGLTGLPGNQLVTLNWNAVSAADLAGYHVFRNGVQVTTSLITSTSYQVTGLENGAAYTFYVKAFDTSGNGSGQSNSVTVTPSGEMIVTMVPNMDSVIVQVTGGSPPYRVSWSGGAEDFNASQFIVTGLAANTDYLITVTDSADGTYSETVNTGSKKGFVPPTFPSPVELFQRMINNFGSAGTIAVAIIAAAVALGVICILGLWGWRLAKRWLSAAA